MKKKRQAMKQVAVRAEQELWEKLDQIAEYEQRDRSNLIRKMLREAVSEYKTKPKRKE